MDSRDKIIEELRGVIAKLEAQLADQAARIRELELELAKAKKNSHTSSKPPSSDLTKPKPKQRPGRPKKRNKGGQTGHQRQLREPLPPERVDESWTYQINPHDIERLGLTPTGKHQTVQHIELPESPVHVTEYHLTEYSDANGHLYYPDSPELRGPIFGPRLLAIESVG